MAILFNSFNPLTSIEIITTTKWIQNRTHKKKRINKKWAKRYGFSEVNSQADGEIVFDQEHRRIYCNNNTFQRIVDCVPRVEYNSWSPNADPYVYCPPSFEYTYSSTEPVSIEGIREIIKSDFR